MYSRPTCCRSSVDCKRTLPRCIPQLPYRLPPIPRLISVRITTTLCLLLYNNIVCADIFVPRLQRSTMAVMSRWYNDVFFFMFSNICGFCMFDKLIIVFPRARSVYLFETSLNCRSDQTLRFVRPRFRFAGSGTW